MKHVKTLCLAAVASLALLATVGAGAASASELCSTNTSPCSGTKYGAGTSIHGQLASGTTATLTSDLVSVHCTASTVGGEITNGGGAEEDVTGKITQLSFTSCKTGGGTNCTVTTVGIGGTQTPHAVGLASGEGNGVMTVTPEAGDPNPGATVVCGLLINCTFRTPHIELDVTGGEPAHVTAAVEELQWSGGLCPSEAFWDATYQVSPSPLFLV
jgi:hypothetical protein